MFLALISFTNLAISVLPVFIFLATLVFLDSYKLVSFRAIVLAIGIGCVCGGVALILSGLALDATAMSGIAYRDDAQIVHETLIKRYGEQAGAWITIEAWTDHDCFKH